MSKISGIRSVDFIIGASGEGVVNNNGSASVYNPAAGQTVKNHMFPKLRGFDPMRKAAPEADATWGKALSLSDPELANAALIVSSNCVRSHIFKTASFGVSEVTRKSAGDTLASLHGLVRGYLITDDGANFARKSPLYLTDFECEKPGLRYNQSSKAGERSETSIFSFFATDKDLAYVGKGSISIEDLQFIPLENSLGRSSFSEVVSQAQGEALAKHVTQYLQDISGDQAAEAKFLLNAVRIGAYAGNGEAGLLLNDAALDVLVKETLDLIQNLYIRQSKGHLCVESLVVDYNDKQAFRILRHASDAVPEKAQPYAVYYEDRPFATADSFEQKMAKLAADLKAAKKSKADKKVKAPKGAPVAESQAESTEESAESSAVNIG